MSPPSDTLREGSLDAPTRHPLEWKKPDFYDEAALTKELERVYDICHGCRRCVSLCNAFPTLFDLVDASPTLEVDGVAKADYSKVVDQCYLCDLCYMTKCPYVPPHPWNVDFPHLMLRAKAVNYQKGAVKIRDRVITSTDVVGRIAGIKVVSETLGKASQSRPVRKLMDKALGLHPDAKLPAFHHETLRKRIASQKRKPCVAAATDTTKGRVILFVTCYGDRNDPKIVEDLIAVFEHNDIAVELTTRERCCGMPKLELGNLRAVEAYKDTNIRELSRWVDEGWDIVAPIPSCVLMFKQELPLMFPAEANVRKVQNAIFDPFEYLALRHKGGHLKTDFTRTLGKVSYHVACHQRVQNIGLKTRDVLGLIPDTSIDLIERCSGHDGTYALKSEFRAASVKICRPVATRVAQSKCDHYTSDCPMAGHQIDSVMANGRAAENPLSLLRLAYGI